MYITQYSYKFHIIYYRFLQVFNDLQMDHLQEVFFSKIKSLELLTKIQNSKDRLKHAQPNLKVIYCTYMYIYIIY
jgi:hypothetical protein